MRRITPLILVVALAASLSGACSGEDDKSADELTDELAEQLERRDDSLDTEQAECYAAIIVEEVGADELQDVDLSADDLPEELESPIAAAASRATDECDLDEPNG